MTTPGFDRTQLLSWPAVVPLLALAAGILWAFVPANGLTARYYPTAQWTGQPTVVVEKPHEAFLLRRPLVLFPDQQPFSVRWDGFLLVEREGPYRFVLESDDGSWLGLDGRPVVDNGGEHTFRPAEATVHLEPGLHPLEIRYFDAGRDRRLRLTWAFDEERLAAVPDRFVFPTRTAYWIRRVGYGYVAPLLVSLSLLAVPVYRGVRHLTRHLAAFKEESRTNVGLLAVLGLAVAVAIPGVGWGVPNVLSWAPDELIVSDVADGLRARFSGGWHGAYPPFHYYVLGLVMAPFEVAERAGLTNVLTGSAQATITVLFRLVSVLMSVGTVYLVYRIAFEIHRDRIAGVLGGLLFASMPLFAYYAGLANLDAPYVFWLALAMLFYVRFVRDPRGTDLTRFAVAATVSVCTKDQAYAFFVLPTLYAVWLRYRSYARRSIGAVVTDRGLWAAGGAAVVAFLIGQNVPFNAQGFLSHVAYLRDTSTYSPQHPATVMGYLQLAAESVVQLSWSMGWPSLLVGVCGLMFTLRRRLGLGLGLVLFVLSYEVFFLAAIRYQFDRFLFGVCLVLAVAGGAALAELVRPRRWSAVLRVAAAALVLYAVLNGAFVPVLMASDSRYGIEAWLSEHVPDDGLIGYVGRRTYLPRFRHGTVRVIERWTWLERRRPDVLVVNAGYQCRGRPGSPRQAFYDRLDSESETYRLVFSHRADPWWPLRGPDAVFRAQCENSTTNLSRINPEIRVYRRVAKS